MYKKENPEKEKQKAQTKTVDQRGETPVYWDLTEQDKAFLRSCKICPD